MHIFWNPRPMVHRELISTWLVLESYQYLPQIWLKDDVQRLKSRPVLLSNSQAEKGRKITQPRDHI